MSNLTEAIQASIPLVSVTYGGTAEEARETLKRVLNKKYIPKISTTMTQTGMVLFVDQKMSVERNYTLCKDNECTGIYMNFANSNPLVMDCGTLMVPPDEIAEYLAESVDEVDNSLVEAYRGLTMTEVDRISRIAMCRYGTLTAASAQAVRRELAPAVNGLRAVETYMLMYAPLNELQQWLKQNAPFMSDTYPELLRPRGLLFTGLPGTGKTSGAKYVAHQMDLPLYRLEVGELLSKWHGESDQNLIRVLQQAERLAPCVLLIDEVEKLFMSGSDAEVTARLLGSLLWWLQEHKAHVLTIMTTNDDAAIPRELLRPGRIDRAITMQPVKTSLGQATHVTLLLRAMNLYKTETEFEELKASIFQVLGLPHPHPLERTQAELEQIVINVTKSFLLTNAS